MRFDMFTYVFEYIIVFDISHCLTQISLEEYVVLYVVFTNGGRDYRIRHGRGICVPTHRSNRIFVRIRVSSGEFTHSNSFTHCKFIQ